MFQLPYRSCVTLYILYISYVTALRYIRLVEGICSYLTPCQCIVIMNVGHLGAQLLLHRVVTPQWIAFKSHLPPRTESLKFFSYFKCIRNGTADPDQSWRGKSALEWANPLKLNSTAGWNCSSSGEGKGTHYYKE